MIRPVQGYQTIPLPDGTVIPGAFPTTEWFRRIQQHVNFEKKRVLDIGCNYFVLGIEALRAGAKWAWGVEPDPENRLIANQVKREWGFQRRGMIWPGTAAEWIRHGRVRFDVTMMSMVLHWLDDGPAELSALGNRAREQVVVIHRIPNPHYKIPQNGKWFPSQTEISSILHAFRLVHSSTLCVQDNDKHIDLLVYTRCTS